MHIGLLEDDPQQAELVCNWLSAAGHDICHKANGSDFLEACKHQLFDMVILDWELPDQTGIEVLNTLRNIEQNNLPVLFTTQRDSEEDIVAALSAGADDYLIKPLRQAELMARLEAMRRRAGIESPSEVISLGPIVIDSRKRSITVHGEAIKVTQKDYEVALLLLSNIGKVLSREFLLKTVWGVEATLNTRTVDVHVSRVRRSLKINPDMGYCIKTIFQHGYRLEKIPATTMSINSNDK
ncbi:response regulator transcription factor [Dasania sp. GY-MA-18]|uniref:Response regulator transcription factor n=1 Tax=Dasania phycosphaerae TaxID=2950436 RepID=A0A9J6RGL8_9GAMM|nr:MULTISPECIES: response regulator transcription factor [Dasania]MCR8921192.1 response regulator transcription factor [Dasania sp. GY-MA-18]MCZ0863620.1 response regulator transcription factor [Dasania phycosphaerae]MCZ0867348.1 response regulator transcription factor [Dasania phycosphaerae]